MNEHKRILVVDDEPQITRVLRRSLQTHGYDVRTAADGEAALDVLHDWPPDLVVTDLTMPGMDGIELCRQLRLQTQLPIIVLSVKGEEQTKVKALDAGADDYVTKPFGMDELLARIRAALRRVPASLSKAASAQLAAGDFGLDQTAHRIILRGTELHLTPKEFELLAYLLQHAGKVLTHRALLAAVWGGDYTEQTEYLRVFVGQLRKKIEADPANPRYILTEPWVGYRFNAEG
ncbi:MAG: response regulator transcription factor [Acidobacteria bacterium]|nr:response regulator transcription factor [Acidobacteriota bacterium]MBI3421782.1 response regulator transcription factor [Acidobacteriota bacterium]